MTHTLTCRAHAIGCAVENLRDSREMGSPVTEGDIYLAEGIAGCYCEREALDMLWAARWVLLGLEAITERD